MINLKSKTNILTILILLGVVLGALIGHFILFDPNATAEAMAERTSGWNFAGNLVLIRPLKLIAAPLIFTSVILGVTSVGDPKKLGFLGSVTLVFYVSTMILAVGTGVTMGAVAKPGAGVPPEVTEAARAQGLAEDAAAVASGGAPSGNLGSAWAEILRLLVPDNFAEALVNPDYLSIITVCIFLGIGLLVIGEKAKPFMTVVESLHEALMSLVRAILWLMPLGVLLLVAAAVGNMGLGVLASALARYVGTVLGGLGVHMFIMLPLVLWLTTRINPYVYMWRIRQALLTAFGTSSSVATLPVTIETTRDLGGCSKRASGLVLPLGATVNMDGTALYQGIAVIFMYQALTPDIALGFSQYLVIVLTATLSAVGAAGIPGGSLVTTIIILNAVNQTLAANNPGIPLLPPAAGLALILPVDRVLDMCRTAVNVWGDSVGARVLTRLAPDIEEEKAEAFA